MKELIPNLILNRYLQSIPVSFTLKDDMKEYLSQKKIL